VSPVSNQHKHNPIKPKNITTTDFESAAANKVRARLFWPCGIRRGLTFNQFNEQNKIAGNSLRSLLINPGLQAED